MKPYYQEKGITIYCGDCREILPSLESIDLLLTDPPYGLGEKWGSGSWQAPNGNGSVWSEAPTWDKETVEFSLLELAINKAVSAIIWGGNYYPLRPSRAWLVWDKCQSFSGGEAELAWSNLGNPVRVFRLSRIDAYQNQAETRKAHPCQKPVALMKWCIQQVRYDDLPLTILDPFMGSGTTLRAAKDLGRRAIGIEIEEKYCEIAAKRLSQEVLDFSPAVKS